MVWHRSFHNFLTCCLFSCLGLASPLLTGTGWGLSVDITGGTTGTIVPDETFDTTWAAQVTVLTNLDLVVSSMTLRDFTVPQSPAASNRVGARIYLVSSGELIASNDVVVRVGSEQSVTVPISARLFSGATYRVGFFIESDGAVGRLADGFAPDPFGVAVPYADASGFFFVNGGFRSGLNLDSLPDSRAFLFPLMDLEVAPVSPRGRFIRGDGNGDGTVDLSDPLSSLFYQFSGNLVPPCLDALDFDDNGLIDINDPLANVKYQFLGSTSPPDPGPSICGPDPTSDLLDCAEKSPDCSVILSRVAPSPFERALVRGLPGRGILELENPGAADVTISGVSLSSESGDPGFSLGRIPALPRTLSEGERIAVEFLASVDRVGLHDIAVEYQTDRGEHIEFVLLEVVDAPTVVRLPAELILVTLPGQSALAVLDLANHAAAVGDFVVDEPSISPAYSVDSGLFPITVPPGDVFSLIVELADPGVFGSEVGGELSFLTNSRRSEDGFTWGTHRVVLKSMVVAGARFSEQPLLNLAESVTLELIVDSLFQNGAITLRSENPQIVQFVDQQGQHVNEIGGLTNNDRFTLVGAGVGEATVSLILEGAEALLLGDQKVTVDLPAPFSRPLVQGLSGKGRVVIPNTTNSPLTITSIFLDDIFDDDLFSLVNPPVLPITLQPGETLELELKGSSTRIGLHRVDVRFVDASGDERVVPVTLDVVAVPVPEIGSKLTFFTLPGQVSMVELDILNDIGAAGDLVVDQAVISPPFAVNFSFFPLRVEPGELLKLPVTLCAGGFGDDPIGKLDFLVNSGPSEDGFTWESHSVDLEVVTVQGAFFSAPLSLGVQVSESRTLIVEPPFAGKLFTVRSEDPNVVELVDGAGMRVEELSGIGEGTPITFFGVSSGRAQISLILEGDQNLLLGLETVDVAPVDRAARLLDNGQEDEVTGNDVLEFIDLPSGKVVEEHRFPPDAFMRGSDVVSVEIAGDHYGLFQPESGATHVYRFSDGSEQGVVDFTDTAGGGTPGLEPATFTESGTVYAVSVDSHARLVSYDVLNATVVGEVSLRDFAPANVTLRTQEDVDLLIHTGPLQPLSPRVYFLSREGQVFVVSLPLLDEVTLLGHLPGGARIGVDGVARAGIAMFQDNPGNVFFAVEEAGGFRTFLKDALNVTDAQHGELFYDSCRIDVDLTPTEDGLFAIQLTGVGHAYVLDQRKLDPAGGLFGQTLTVLKAPFEAGSVIGVDPRIARYDPGLAIADRLRQARVVIAYGRNVVRIFSMDGVDQWTFEPVIRSRVGEPVEWTSNIDIILGPRGADGLENVVILKYGDGVIRVVDLRDGRVLHTIMDPQGGVPINGVDPVLTADGRFLIDVSVRRGDRSDLAPAVGAKITDARTARTERVRTGRADLSDKISDMAGLDRGKTARSRSGRLDDLVRSSLPSPDESDLGRARIYIHGVAPANGGDPGTFGQLVEVAETVAVPSVDVDPVLHESGAWFSVLGSDGKVLVADLQGQVVTQQGLRASSSAGGERTISGVDLVMPRESANAVDPDEDLAFFTDSPPQNVSDNQDQNPPPSDIPGLVIDPGLDLVDVFVGNPNDDFSGTGGGARGGPVGGVGMTCHCTATTVNLEENLSDQLFELLECPLGEFSVADFSAQYPAAFFEGPVMSMVPDTGGRVALAQSAGQAVLDVRTCVDPTIPAEELQGIVPAQVNMEVVAPFVLWADSPYGSAMVSKGSGPDCMAIPCGESVFFDAFTCPGVCIEELKIGQPNSTTTGQCDLIDKELLPVSSGEGVAFWDAPGVCKVYKAILHCKSTSAQLEPIIICVADLENDVTFTSLTSGVGQDERFEAQANLCNFNTDNLKACRDPCDPTAAFRQLEQTITWTITDPLGNVSNAGPGTRISFEASEPGPYTVKARLGGCEATGTITAKKRVDPDSFRPGGEQPADNDPTMTGDPIYTHSGEVVETVVDLTVPARGIPFTWTRRYKSQVSYLGPLGNNWDFSYNEWLTFDDHDGDGDTDVKHVGLNFQSVYTRSGNAPLDFQTPDGQFTRLRRNDDGSYSIRYPRGEIHTFHGQEGMERDGRLMKIEDARGNFMSFHYEGRELHRVFDTFGRLYTLEWADGKIVKLIDFAGREVVYDYYKSGDSQGSAGDLKSVRTPVVVGTPGGNDFPDGKKTVYTYLTGAINSELLANLESITRPNEVVSGGPPAITFSYGTNPGDPLTFDRALTSVEGGTNLSGVAAGGTYQYYYENINEGADPADLTIGRRHTILVDRNGNITSFFFNNRFKLIRKRVYTGRFDPTRRFPHAIDARGPGVRADLVPGIGRPGPDPAFYERTFAYNRNNDKIRETFPEGNQILYEYAFENDANPLARGNVTQIRWVVDGDRPAALEDSSIGERVVSFTYEPWTNGIHTTTEERGQPPDFDGIDEDSDPDGAARYTRTVVFDYQEMDPATVQAQAAAWGVIVPDTFVGLGDVNGDGFQGPMQGLAVKEIEPTATVLEWDGQDLGHGAPQSAFFLRRYNEFGQIATEVDVEENVTDYEYYPEEDPDGTGQNFIGGNNSTGGYLKSVIRDSALAPGRNSGTNPVPERRRSELRYNVHGQVSASINGRGVVTSYVRNELDQIVRTVRAESLELPIPAALPEDALVRQLGYVVDRFYDHNGNVIREEVENRHSGTDAQNPTFEQEWTHDILNKVVQRVAEIDVGVHAVWQYRYDGNENQILVTSPEGNEERAAFDERDLLFTRTEGANDPDLAATTIYTHDKNGNTQFVIDAEDNDGDGLPETTESVFDGWDRLARTIDAAGQETRYTYDLTGNLIEVSVFGTQGGPTPRRAETVNLSLLSRTKSFYDERGRRVQEDKALFGSFTAGLETEEGPLTPNGNDISAVWEFDRLDRVTRMVDDRGNDIRQGYNGLSEPILLETEEVNGARNSVRWTYDRAGNTFRIVETEALPGGGVDVFETTRLFDALDREVRVTDPVGQTTYRAYDSRSHLTVMADPKGPTLPSDPTGAVVGMSINRPGNTTRIITDGLGRMATVVKDLRIGGVGTGEPSFDTPPDPAAAPLDLDLANAANPDGMITQNFVYDANSRLIFFIDDRGSQTEFRYDALDRVSGQIYADGSEWVFRYDRDHHRTFVNDPSGSTKRTEFDSLGRLSRIEVERGLGVQGTTLSSAQWDGLDRPTRYFENNDPADPADDHVVTYSYDSLSHTLDQTQAGIAVQCQFDGVGNKRNTRYPTDQRRLEREYDPLDRCDALKLHGLANPVTLCETDFAGPGSRRMVERLGNGLDTTFDYDAKRRLRSLESRRGAETVTGRAYAYDRGDFRVSERWLERDAPGGREGRVYALDSQNRMVRADSAILDTNENTVQLEPASASYEWTLDGTSNWVLAKRPGDDLESSYNVLNQDVAKGHDGNGNRTRDLSHTYVYDAFNRLVEVWNSAATRKIEAYTYDTMGRRVTRAVREGENFVTTRFVYDGPHVIEEHTGTEVVRNYHGDHTDRLVARETPSDGLSWLHSDIVQSTTAVTDANGDVLERYEYSPFGEVRHLDDSFQPILDNNGAETRSSSIGNPYLFLGRRLDASGLYYFRSRYYDPAHGRFLQRDANRDPLNFGNLYTYAGNNPLTYIDPWGLSGAAQADSLGATVKKYGTAFLKGAWKGLKESFKVPSWSDLKKAWDEFWEFLDDPGKFLKGILKYLRGLSGEELVEMLGELFGGFVGNMLVGGGLAGGAMAAKKFTTFVSKRLGGRKGPKSRTGRRRDARDEPAESGGCKDVGKCFVAGTLVLTLCGLVPIEDIEVGQRVETAENETAEPTVEVDHDWRILEVVIAPDANDPADVRRITLLRSAAWLARNYDAKTDAVFVNFEELRVRGMARVLSIKPSGPVEKGPGRVVTATVSSLSSSVHEIRLVNEPKPIEATAYHLFYSLDRQAWVRAKELKPEEDIETVDGAATVASVRRVFGEYQVYNLEVEGTHTFYVGASGVYTHNTNQECPDGAKQGASKGRVTLTRRFSARKSYSDLEVEPGSTDRRHIVADSLTRDVVEHIANLPDAQARRILSELGYDPEQFGGSIHRAATRWRNDVSNKPENLWVGEAAENQMLGRGIAGEVRSGRGINAMGGNAVDLPPPSEAHYWFDE